MSDQSAYVPVAVPRLARAVWTYIKAVGRKHDSIVDWCKRQGWAASDALEAITWLERNKFVEVYERGGVELYRLHEDADPAEAPEGEERPAADTKRRAPARPVEPIDIDEDEGDSDDDSPVDSDDDDQDDDEPESDRRPAPPRAPRTPPRRRADPTPVAVRRVPPQGEQGPGAWLKALEAYLATTRTQNELGQWAMHKCIPYSRIRDQLAEWRREGRVTSTGRAGGTRYSLDGAPLERRPPMSVEEIERIADKAANPAPDTRAPAPAPVPEYVTPAPAPEVVLRALAGLPAAERAAVVERAPLVSRLAARVEQLAGEASHARAELEAAIMGELPPVATGPTRGGSHRGLSRDGSGPSLDERVWSTFAPGAAQHVGAVAERLAISAQRVSGALSRLVQIGRLRRVGKGVYALPGKAVAA